MPKAPEIPEVCRSPRTELDPGKRAIPLYGSTFSNLHGNGKLHTPIQSDNHYRAAKTKGCPIEATVARVASLVNLAVQARQDDGPPKGSHHHTP